MMRSLQLMAIGALVLPLAAQAQVQTQTPIGNTDRDYCHQLSVIYERYIGRSYTSPRNDYRRAPLPAEVAVTQCDGRNVTDAIAVLENQLKRNKFDLPPRG